MRRALVGVVALAVVASLAVVATPAPAAPAVRYTNSLLAQRADPHI